MTVATKQDIEQRDYEEQMARIHNFNIDTAKKLTEIRFIGWQVAFAGFTAGAAVIGVIIALLKLWPAG